MLLTIPRAVSTGPAPFLTSFTFSGGRGRPLVAIFMLCIDPDPTTDDGTWNRYLIDLGPLDSLSYEYKTGFKARKSKNLKSRRN